MTGFDALLLAAPLAGLFGSGHCVPMCGGIVGLFAQGLREQPAGRRLAYLLLFNAGRVAMYATLGWLIGSGASALKYALPTETVAQVLRVLAGLMLILMGLYVARIWLGLTRLEVLSRPIWQRVQPLALRLQRVPHLHGAFGAGALWGLLPCGLVYSALGTAAGTQSAPQAALFMALFGLGTLPALITAGWLMGTRPPAARPQWRMISAGLLLLVGSWSLYSAAAPWFGVDPHAGHRSGTATQEVGQDHGHHHHTGD